MKHVGDAIITLRQSRGLTQAGLAASAGITQPALHRYEAGTRTPLPEHLAAIARVLGVTEAFITHDFKLQGGIAQDAHMRKQKTTKAGDWKLVEARLNELRMITAYFFGRAPLKQQLTVPEVDMLVHSAEEAAQLTRSRWRMPSGPVTALVPWLESAGIVVIFEDFPTTRIDGMSQWGKESALLMINRALPAYRQRLTMAHELGHLVMHDTVFAGDDDIEAEANDFAAEFLMPAHLVRNELRPLRGATMQRTLSLLSALKPRWGVSMQALYERAFKLGITSRDHRAAFYRTLAAKRWRSREPGDENILSEEARLAPSIGSSLREVGLPDSEIATLLGNLSLERVRSFFPAGTPQRAHLRAVT